MSNIKNKKKLKNQIGWDIGTGKKMNFIHFFLLLLNFA